MKEKIHKFWNHLSPTMNNMVLDKGSEVYDLEEQQEILSLLPDFSQKKVLELAAGIGRFTGHLAHSAQEVNAIDFAPHFLKQNQETHKTSTNITYTCRDARNLDYPKETFDFIFINWLFLYFEDKELIPYIAQLQQWLKPGGYLHYEREDYTAIYRFHYEYDVVLKNFFSVKKWGILLTYLRYRKLPNQFYWLCQKKG
jgi:phosphoethanolamine N-methyltransferase